jgi:ferrochelatase
MNERLGVLLMTYGSPAPDLHDLPAYLAAVRGGRAASDDLVAEFRRRYELIGGSPLIAITRAQAEAVEHRLRSRGIDARATVGMRFSEPSIADGLGELTRSGCTHIVAIVMSPQYSDLLMSGYRRAIDEAKTAMRDDTPLVRVAPAWYREPDFVSAVAERIRDGLGLLSDGTPVLLTAHSLPRRVADAEPAYLEQLRETAATVARAAGLAEGAWKFCWQSAGHEPGAWMKPDFADVLPQLRTAGHTSVLVAPIQFLADHLEILYDIDIGAREQAEAAGMRFERIQSLNLSPRFIAALAKVATEQTTAGTRPRPVGAP